MNREYYIKEIEKRISMILEITKTLSKAEDSYNNFIWFIKSEPIPWTKLMKYRELTRKENLEIYYETFSDFYYFVSMTH